MRSFRVAGKMHNEHIASLGSVDADVSVRERLAFWAKLPERLARLGNRVGPDEHAKIYGALHARIPMVTPDDQRAIQAENAADDERFWDAVADLSASNVEGHKALIAKAEATVAEESARATQAAERVEAARDRLARLKRGEAVAGGLGKRMDVEAMFKAAGLTPSDIRRIELSAQANLTDAEFDAMVKRIVKNEIAAGDKVHERELRRIIRAKGRA
jgi:hypothetical protein